MDDQITAPAQKAVIAIGAGAGSSVTAIAASAGSFLPSDLAGWLAATASLLAVIYTLGLLCEWWWKRVWKPLIERFNWLGWLRRGP